MVFMTTKNPQLPNPPIDPVKAARQLVRESGLTAAQIGRLTGVTGRAVANWAAGSTPSPRRTDRIRALHELVFSLDASDPTERRRLMLTSVQGPSLFWQFQDETVRPQRIQYPVPVMERLGA